MSSQNHGGSAFPHPERTEPDNEFYGASSGMTLRDWFAGQALISVYGSGDRYGPEGMRQVAEHAYAMADAMLKQRSE